MNTADRSIGSVDLAVRRRFAFIKMLPDVSVIERINSDSQVRDLALNTFNRLVQVFVEHAPDEALDLLPGHSYFLAENEGQLKRRFRYELLPLLEEYLKAGYLGPASSDLQAVHDELEDAVR